MLLALRIHGLLVLTLTFALVCLQACVVLFGVATLCFFLSVTIYGGIINSTKGKPHGQYGSGFGLTIWST